MRKSKKFLTFLKGMRVLLFLRLVGCCLAFLSGTVRRCEKTKAAKGFGSAPPTKNVKEDPTKVLVKSQEKYAKKIYKRSKQISSSLAAEDVAIIDGLLGVDDCIALRREAAKIHKKFSREASGTEYDSPGVDRTRAELLSPEDFQRAPRTVAMMLAMAGLSKDPLIAQERSAKLSTDPSANMLSCYVKGGAFPPHLDNHGGDDRRLIGLIYYMNPDYEADTGGRFVARSADSGDNFIEPKGDRLIAFYCDKQEHWVEEFTPKDAYFRYALTVWLIDDGDQALDPNRMTKSPTEAHRKMRDALAASRPT